MAFQLVGEALFIQGQHEKSYPPYLGLADKAAHVDYRNPSMRFPVTSKPGWPTVAGLDHCHSDALPEALEKAPECDIFLCHQVWQEFMNFGVEGSLKSITNANLIVTGDLHINRSLVLDKEAAFDRRVVLSPGAGCLTEITEPADHGFFVIYDDLSFEAFEVKSRKVFDAMFNNANDVECWMEHHLERVTTPQEGVPEEISRNIVYIQSAEIPQAYTRVARALEGKAFLFWKDLIPEAMLAQAPVTEQDRMMSEGLRGCLELACPRESQVYSDCLRVLDSANPAAELDKMTKEAGL
jgi:hypothetical protein